MTSSVDKRSSIRQVRRYIGVSSSAAHRFVQRKRSSGPGGNLHGSTAPRRTNASTPRSCSEFLIQAEPPAELSWSNRKSTSSASAATAWRASRASRANCCNRPS
ncbi:MAG: hypothetical protein HY289_08825 [Planctomycetes bacterium]|nr:hypothetical protein [Planctomycetota bacterium]